jgi:hypothetical protein
VSWRGIRPAAPHAVCVTTAVSECVRVPLSCFSGSFRWFLDFTVFFVAHLNTSASALVRANGHYFPHVIEFDHVDNTKHASIFLRLVQPHQDLTDGSACVL